MTPTTILLADDHTVVRKGIEFLTQDEPDLQAIGEARDGREAVEMYTRLRPKVVILDMSMPVLNGLEAAAQISRIDETASLIILSMHTDETYIMRAISAGVRGYVSKESAEDEIIDAIRTVAGGRPFLSASIAARMLQNPSGLTGNEPRDPYESLTSREKQVLQLIAEGRTNKEVAAMLKLSPHTIETHRTNLMQKLGLHTVAEVVRYAVRRNLIA